LLVNYQSPTNSIEFERDLKAFEGDYELAYQYLMKTSPKLLEKIYENH